MNSISPLAELHISKCTSSTMSDQTAVIDPNVDPYGSMGLVRNPDGSVTRLPELLPRSPASADPSNSFHLSKDIPINQSKNTWARIFVPREAFDISSITKLPIIVYFHAGGFVIFSADTSLFDNFYTTVVTEIPAIIVSVEYRRAPEHRLPAAYDDCMEALHWIKNSEDDWLTKYGDISKCFLMGSSAGGNISYHVGLHAAACVDDLKPLKIKGLILHHPFFGGTKRTDSEMRLANDKAAPLSLCDLLWELSLPIGADRDHKYCNPMMGIITDQFDQINFLKWRVLVTGYDGDPLIDRQIEFVKKLEDHGVLVFGKFEERGAHCYEFHVPTKAKELANVVSEFIVSSTAS